MLIRHRQTTHSLAGERWKWPQDPEQNEGDNNSLKFTASAQTKDRGGTTTVGLDSPPASVLPAGRQVTAGEESPPEISGWWVGLHYVQGETEEGDDRPGPIGSSCCSNSRRGRGHTEEWAGGGEPSRCEEAVYHPTESRRVDSASATQVPRPERTVRGRCQLFSKARAGAGEARAPVARVTAAQLGLRGLGSGPASCLAFP